MRIGGRPLSGRSSRDRLQLGGTHSGAPLVRPDLGAPLVVTRLTLRDRQPLGWRLDAGVLGIRLQCGDRAGDRDESEGMGRAADFLDDRMDLTEQNAIVALALSRLECQVSDGD